MPLELTQTVVVSDEMLQDIANEFSDNWPECSENLLCLKWKYATREFTFLDEEDNTEYTVNQASLVEGLKKLLLDGRYSPPLPTPFTDEKVGDWLCRCDGDTFDALAQFCCFGEVIYG